MNQSDPFFRYNPGIPRDIKIERKKVDGNRFGSTGHPGFFLCPPFPSLYIEGDNFRTLKDLIERSG